MFPETHILADQIQKLVKKQALITKPKNAENRDEFVKVYGDCEVMPNADFEYASKVEPFGRGLTLSQKEILITGRRADQGNARVELAIWEDDKKTFNPLADWTWLEVCQAVSLLNIPYNVQHNVVYRSSQAIPATKRHIDGLPWEVVDLKKPYWAATEAEIYGEPRAEFTYVWKSFGDVHSSVPVDLSESERYLVSLPISSLFPSFHFHFFSVFLFSPFLTFFQSWTICSIKQHRVWNPYKSYIQRPTSWWYPHGFNGKR